MRLRGNWSNQDKILGKLDFLFEDDGSDGDRGLASLTAEDEPTLVSENLIEEENKSRKNRSGYSKEGIIQNRNFDLFKAISMRYRRKFFVKKQ